MNEGETLLSVIVIGRNEERHIEACLRSVLKAVRGLPHSEILYVDSASTDGTLSLARFFPIRILQLKPDWFLSAAAGRYIGTLNTGGRYLLFVDGDTVLYRGWPRKGIEYLEAHPEAAAVAGTLHELVVDRNGRARSLLKDRYGRLDQPRSERTLGGIALYRRSVLDRVGTFNPYLSVDEESELGFRIRREGAEMRRIPELMAITFGPPRETIREVRRRYRTGLYAFGTTLRYCRRNGFARRYIRERLGFITSFVLALVLLSAGVAAALLAGFAGPLLLIAATGAAVGRFLKPRLFRRIWISFIKRSLITLGTVRSYFGTTCHEVGDYPRQATLIQYAPGGGPSRRAGNQGRRA